MKVWYIEEDCHGCIGLASSWDKACDFLIETGWLTESTIDTFGLTPKNYWGDNWREVVKNDLGAFDLENFGFYLREVTVYD